MNGLVVQRFQGVDLEIGSGYGLDAPSGHRQTVGPSVCDSKLRRLVSENVDGREQSLRAKKVNLKWRLDVTLVARPNAHVQIAVAPRPCLRHQKVRDCQ